MEDDWVYVTKSEGISNLQKALNVPCTSSRNVQFRMRQTPGYGCDPVNVIYDKKGVIM